MQQLQEQEAPEQEQEEQLLQYISIELIGLLEGKRTGESGPFIIESGESECRLNGYRDRPFWKLL